jgi:uncharacterized membrane protein required for colicin V production
LGGVGFGFIRGIIVSAIIVMILTMILREKAPILSESKLTPCVMSISKVLVFLVPDDLQKRFKERKEKLLEFWERKSKPKIVAIYQKSWE